MSILKAAALTQRPPKNDSRITDQVVQEPVGRQVAAFRDAAHDGTVGEIVQVVIVVADIEKAELAQPVGLVDLEVKTD